MQAKNILFTLNRNGGSGFIKKKLVFERYMH